MTQQQHLTTMKEQRATFPSEEVVDGWIREWDESVSVGEPSISLLRYIALKAADWQLGEVCDFLNSAELAIEEWGAMTWQPIDTAPKDGTEILASDGYDTIDIVSWCKWPELQRGSAPRASWVTRDCEVFFPCWWQPLPDHPSLPEEAQQ